MGERMLLLITILGLIERSDVRPNDLLAEARWRVGNGALTVISLVYILITYWQR